MGWDDNGLPSERRVQNYYGVRCDPSLPYEPDYQPPEGGTGAKTRVQDQTPISRGNFVELCDRLTAEDEKAYADVWRRLALSVDWSGPYRTIDRRSTAISQKAFLRNLARGEAYQAEAPSLWDTTFRTAVAQAELEDRERPGAYHRIAFARSHGSADRAGAAGAPGPHRDDPARAAAGVRRARGPPGRRALPAAVRHDRPHAAVRRRGAGRGAPARGAGQGLGHRHDLHLRRPHRRHLVARAAAAHPGDRRGRRAAAAGPTRGGRRHGVRADRRQDRALRPGGGRRDAAGVGRPRGRAEADHPPGQVLRAGRAPARDRHDPAVVHPQRRPRHRDPRRAASRAARRSTGTRRTCACATSTGSRG